MKILQLYSNDHRFRPAKFNEQFNVILGKVARPKEKDTDTHNLGKSTLIEMLDFMLLKSISKDHFLKRHEAKFLNHVFFLEILLNTGKVLTIRRSVQQSSKVSFKLHVEKYQNFIDLKEWDYSDLPLSSHNLDINPKALLNRFLSFDVLSSTSFRQMLNYFLRTQYDYKDVFHLSKFKGTHADWKPYLFELLGFSPTSVREKYEKETDIEQQTLLKSQLQTKYAVKPQEIDRLQGAIEAKSLEAERLQERIDNFSFYSNDRSVSDELVKEIEAKISDLNTMDYDISYEIEKLAQSLQNGISFNPDEVEILFKEASIHFPSQLKKSYSELLDFQKQLSAERIQYVSKQLEKAREKKDSILAELRRLDSDRERSMKQLKEQDSFRKFKKYQQELITIEADIATLKARQEQVDIVSTIATDIEKSKNRIEVLSKQIMEQLKEGNELYSKIRKQFSILVKDLVGLTGIISIVPNDSGNIDFKADIVDMSSDSMTSMDQGYSYRKLLCAAFDLSVLICHSEHSFFRFVVHDGVFESLDNRRKEAFLSVVRSLSKTFNIQYILTLIEHDAPNGISTFPKHEIALELDDSEGNKGRLFGFDF